jgi:hypothetical protein
MYHLCQACPALPGVLTKLLPPSVFNLDEIRPAYEERRRRDLGLFAATLG